MDAWLEHIAAITAGFPPHAAALDDAAAFPAADIAALAEAGALTAGFDRGLGTRADTAAETLHVFTLLGRGNLSVGRLLEAHVNAIRLVLRYGSTALQDRVRHDAEYGHLIGLWVTDPPHAGLVYHRGLLTGAKQFCSGAGHATRAVITATDEAGETRLGYTALGQGAAASPLPGGLAGMRAAKTGQIRFDRVEGELFGAPGDYLREPDLSCGAWRTSAVTLGGLQALAAEFRAQLAARGRDADPHQQARLGQVMIAAETARLWMEQAAIRAEVDGDIAYTGLARLAVERACLDVIELVQRGLGAAAFLRSNPVECLCRDLATYLRQPAPDMVLTEAAMNTQKDGRLV